MKTPAEKTAAGVLAALFALCVFRAATQSIVHDEAFTWQLYLTTPKHWLFHHFDPNHHFLHTLLLRLSTSLFGFSELAMRLPALLGAALYFTAVWRFCRWALGDGWRLPLAVAATALNPLVLDFLAIARGYGLALALWMWALALAGPELEKETHDRKRIALAGLCAALSVTANLVFVLPVLATSAIVLGIGWRREAQAARANREAALALARSLTEKKARKKLRAVEAARPPLWRDYLVPAVAVAVLFLIFSPVRRANATQLIVGAASIGESLRSLAAESLASSAADLTQPFALWMTFIGMALGPAIVLAGAVAALRTGRVPLLLASLPAAVSAVLLLVLHFAAGLLYPVDRTGLYFLPAAALTLALFGGEAWPRAARVPALALTAAVVVCFAAQIRWQWYSTWRYDADTARFAERLEQERERNPTARIAHSWELEPALNFYRITRGYQRLPEFERNPVGPGADLYVLIPKDQKDAQPLGLRTVYRGPASGSVLAVK
jgi:uncharacterized membrane protein